MAINYSGFAQQGGAGAGRVRNMFSSIADAIPTADARRASILSAFWSERDMALPTFSYDEGMSVSSAGKIDYKAQTLTEAWNDYTGRLRSKGLKPGDNEWQTFKETYDSKMAIHGQEMLNKFNLMKARGFKSPEIRKAIEANPGMRQELIKLAALNPEVGSQIAPYLMGGKGIVPGLWDRKGDLAMAPALAATFKGLPAAIRAGTAMPAGSGVAKTALGALKGGALATVPGYGMYERSRAALGGRPFGSIGRATDKSVADALTKSLKDTRRTPTRGYRTPVEGLDKGHRIFRQAKVDALKKSRSVRRRKGEMDAARNAYVKMKMKAKGWSKAKANRYWKSSKADFKYRGKSYKGYQQFVGVQKKDIGKGSLEVAEKALKDRLSKGGGRKAIMTATKDYIEKHGYGKLIKDIMKKAGPKTTAKLIAKTGLSGIMKGASPWTAGVSGAASLALDAHTLYQIGKILFETVRDESGGIARRHDKMLFGSGKPTLDRAKQYTF